MAFADFRRHARWIRFPLGLGRVTASGRAATTAKRGWRPVATAGNRGFSLSGCPLLHVGDEPAGAAADGRLRSAPPALALEKLRDRMGLLGVPPSHTASPGDARLAGFLFRRRRVARR